mmetsp:Transcript_30238/g.98337  ORF Transcript_30238/g.98337 Transcript_30238/m.98337 type:complete len:216 (+) Transcript_30238:606-1253(+)
MTRRVGGLRCCSSSATWTVWSCAYRPHCGHCVRGIIEHRKVGVRYAAIRGAPLASHVQPHHPHRVWRRVPVVPVNLLQGVVIIFFLIFGGNFALNLVIVVLCILTPFGGQRSQQVLLLAYLLCTRVTYRRQVPIDHDASAVSCDCISPARMRRCKPAEIVQAAMGRANLPVPNLHETVAIDRRSHHRIAPVWGRAASSRKRTQKVLLAKAKGARV